MKFCLLNFILILNYVFINCDFEDNEDFEDHEGNLNNINIESISYELTYSNNSVVKVVIKSYDTIDSEFSFIAYLKSYNEKKAYKLNCTSSIYDIIECFSERNVTFNLDDQYYFYYNKTSKYTFDENDILEDDNHISLVFKPDITIDNFLYKDNKKFIVETDGNMIGGGYLYITRKSKNVLNKQKDCFNRYIELNSIIPKIGFHKDIPISTFNGYKKAILNGYHIVDAILRFTKDSVPVISHVEDLEDISNGKGKISAHTFKQLQQLNFNGDKILCLEVLLQLCKEFNIIIELNLSQLDNSLFEGNNKTSNKAYKLMNLIEKYDMFNSIYFSDGPDCKNLLTLKKIKKDISVSISNIKNKEAFDKIKDNFKGSKRIILSLGEKSKLKEEDIKDILSLELKIKVNDVNDFNYFQQLQSWGVNYVTTKIFPSFLVETDKEIPILARCLPLDDMHSECEVEDEDVLRDNEWYNIYYSKSIYNIAEDIDTSPLAYFQYVDTYILDELYYKINKFNFEEGVINLNLSHVLNKGDEINGIVGPEYDNVPECYKFNFICQGNNSVTVNCKIEKDEENKTEIKGGNYYIYSLEDYSFNEYETDVRNAPEETYMEYITSEKKRPFLWICVIVIIVIICMIVFYCIKYKSSTEHYDRIRIADNNYLTDNYLFR